MRAGEESPTIARSQVYRLLARSFAFPDEALYEDVTKGRWQEQVSQVLPQFPFELAAGGGAAVAFPFAEFQAEYNRLFEVGTMGGPPCPLFGGHHERDRMRVMEELIRFYNYFGLSMAAGQLPDHITVELEFMHYLTFKEAEARQQNREQDSYQRAQKDFLDRHLGKWVPVLRQKLFNFDPPPFFAELVTFTDEFVGRDRQYLKSILNPSPF
ncbi:MAG: molecular chaperone TorD family protein [Chloroflexota bacterium]|nr:molecular chaperone TorD family protein [Chloroflexota bacterium]